MKNTLKIRKQKRKERVIKKFNLRNFTRGWIIGDFLPSIIKTKDFEIGVKRYKAGDEEPRHFHKKAIEITIINKGEFKLNNQILKKDDIVLIDKGTKVKFECLKDGSNTVIKIPSVIGDKYYC